MPEVQRFAIALSNEQAGHGVDEPQLVAAVREILADSSFSAAEISIAVVDDSTIHDLNRQYLGHDYPTDVLSFVLDQRDDHLQGEVVISADTAAAKAMEIGWSAAAEQLLYVIHGALHLVGFNDKDPVQVAEMRGAEQRYLRRFGFDQPSCADS